MKPSKINVVTGSKGIDLLATIRRNPRTETVQKVLSFEQASAKEAQRRQRNFVKEIKMFDKRDKAWGKPAAPTGPTLLIEQTGREVPLQFVADIPLSQDPEKMTKEQRGDYSEIKISDYQGTGVADAAHQRTARALGYKGSSVDQLGGKETKSLLFLDGPVFPISANTAKQREEGQDFDLLVFGRGVTKGVAKYYTTKPL